MVVSEDLQIAEKRRDTKCKGERERYTHLNAEFQIYQEEKAFLSEQMQRKRRKQ